MTTRLFRYVTLRDGYVWFSDQDRVCDPAVNEKTVYVTESFLAQEVKKARAEGIMDALKEVSKHGYTCALYDNLRVMVMNAYGVNHWGDVPAKEKA